MDWGSLFLPTMPVVELILRGTITFLALLLLLRLMGQRESGGLSLVDLLVVVLAASAGLLGDSESIGDGLILVITILVWSMALDAVAYRWPRLGRMLKARPKALIRDGELNRRVMRRELMNHDEVLSQLRLHGITDPGDVYRAFVEPNGMISVIARPGAEDAQDTEAPEPPKLS